MLKRRKKKTSILKRKPQTTVSQNEPHQNFTGSKNQTNQGPSMKKENIAIKCLKKIYRIIEIVYTLSFFLFLVYFVIGCFIHDNRSDNELLMIYMDLGTILLLRQPGQLTTILALKPTNWLYLIWLRINSYIIFMTLLALKAVTRLLYHILLMLIIRSLVQR